MSRTLIAAAWRMPSHLPADWPGWLIIGILLFPVARFVLKLLRIIR